jgi:hypothetical protein
MFIARLLAAASKLETDWARDRYKLILQQCPRLLT